MKPYVVLILMLIVPAVSSAQAPAPDTLLKLKNGTEVRGVLVEVKNGVYVLTLTDGKTAMYPTSDVDTAERLLPPPPPPPPAPAPANPAPPAPPKNSGSGGAIKQGDAKGALLSVAPEKAYSTLVEVLAGKYRIESSDKDSMTVSFRSGMSAWSWKGQDGSCIVVPADDNTRSKVICNTEKRGTQLYAWGEGGKIQKEVLKLLTASLHERGFIPASEVVK